MEENIEVPQEPQEPTEPTFEEIRAELDALNMAAINKANEPKVYTVNELKAQRLVKLQRIYTKQSLRITAIQIDKETATDAEYIKAQYENYRMRYELALKAKNDGTATDIDNSVIQASEGGSIYVAYARTVLDEVRGKLTDDINAGTDVDAKLDFIDNLTAKKEGMTKENIDKFMSNF